MESKGCARAAILGRPQYILNSFKSNEDFWYLNYQKCILWKKFHYVAILTNNRFVRKHRII